MHNDFFCNPGYVFTVNIWIESHFPNHLFPPSSPQCSNREAEGPDGASLPAGTLPEVIELLQAAAARPEALAVPLVPTSPASW